MFTLSIAEVVMMLVVVLLMEFVGFFLLHLVDKLQKELDESNEAYEFIQKKLIEANNDKVKYVDIIDLLSERDGN